MRRALERKSASFIVASKKYARKTRGGLLRRKAAVSALFHKRLRFNG